MWTCASDITGEGPSWLELLWLTLGKGKTPSIQKCPAGWCLRQHHFITTHGFRLHQALTATLVLKCLFTLFLVHPRKHLPFPSLLAMWHHQRVRNRSCLILDNAQWCQDTKLSLLVLLKVVTFLQRSTGYSLSVPAPAMEQGKRCNHRAGKSAGAIYQPNPHGKPKKEHL